MNTSKDNPTTSNTHKSLRFPLNRLELGFSILVGLATWFWLRNSLQSTLPFPCGSSINSIPGDCGWTEKQAWETLGYPIFSTYAIPLTLFLTISGVFLIHGLFKNVGNFSIIGNISLSFPIFAFLGFFLFSVFSLPFQPIGLILAILATINSGMTKNHKRDWISLPFNLSWLVIFGLFISRFLNSYGD